MEDFIVGDHVIVDLGRGRLKEAKILEFTEDGDPVVEYRNQAARAVRKVDISQLTRSENGISMGTTMYKKITKKLADEMNGEQENQTEIHYEPRVRRPKQRDPLRNERQRPSSSEGW